MCALVSSLVPGFFGCRKQSIVSEGKQVDRSPGNGLDGRHWAWHPGRPPPKTAPRRWMCVFPAPLDTGR